MSTDYFLKIMREIVVNRQYCETMKIKLLHCKGYIKNKAGEKT